MPEPDRPSAPPRLAATTLVVRDDPFEVLMVRRHKDQSFSSALVFPGGTVDESDASEDWLPLLADAQAFSAGARALRIAAFRETFEETSVLLARNSRGHCAPPAGSDAASPFLEVVRSSGGRLHLGDLVPFGHWVTPDFVPKRFDTHFFLCAAAPGQEALCDGRETVAVEWAAPDDILRRAAEGETAILFPTRMNVSRLAESANVADALAAARRREVYTVNPRAEQREGGTAILIPAEAGYSETEHFQPHEPRQA